MTNALAEKDKAVIRPGLAANSSYSGVGNGLVSFGGHLLSIFGNEVTDTNLAATSAGFPLDSAQYSASTTYAVGDAVWYNGTLFFSRFGSNIGHTPTTGSGYGAYWVYSINDACNTYNASTTYNIGDIVYVDCTPYYMMADGIVGANPLTSAFWSVTAPTATRYIAKRFDNAYYGNATADVNSAGASYFGYPGAPHGVYNSCSFQFGGWYVFDRVIGTNVRAIVWTNGGDLTCAAPAVSSGPSGDMGVEVTVV